jgi:hypothetical protein
VGKGADVEKAVLTFGGVDYIDGLAYAEENLNGAGESVIRGYDGP